MVLTICQTAQPADLSKPAGSASPACLEVYASQHNNLSCRRNSSQSDQTGNNFLLQQRNWSNSYQNIIMLRTWNRGASHKDYRGPLLRGGVSNVRISLSEAGWRSSCISTSFCSLECHLVQEEEAHSQRLSDLPRLLSKTVSVASRKPYILQIGAAGAA